MSNDYNIEELLIKKLEGLEIEPSGNAWLKTQRVLRRKNFLRFRARKFNVFYASTIVIVAGLIGGIAITQSGAKEDAELRKENISIEPVGVEESYFAKDTAHGARNPQPATHKPQTIDKVENLTENVTEELSPSPGLPVSHSPSPQVSPSGGEINKPIPEVKTLITYFTPSVTSGCAPLEVSFVNHSENGIAYEWNLGEPDTRNLTPHTSHTYYKEGEYTVSLTAMSEDGTIGTYSQVITVYPKPHADFTIEDGSVYNYSIGANEYEWGLLRKDAQRSAKDTQSFSSDFQPNLEAPSSLMPNASRLFLIAKNTYGCIDTISQPLPLPPSPTLLFPSAFSPSPSGPTSGYYNANESSNSIFHPQFTEEPIEFNLTIYNRSGKLIFQTTDIHIGWDGYYREAPVQRGVYVWKCTGKWKNGTAINQQGDITALWSN